MIKNTITMSENAFLSMLELLNCAGKYQFPKYPETSNEVMQQFLKGREELCENGWAELDFDGKICPTAWFARMIFALTNVRSSMSYMKDEHCEWFFQGPMEQLHITRKESIYTLTQCGTDELLVWLKDTLYKAERGVLTTYYKDREESLELTKATEGTKQRADQLARHMCIYFEKETANA
jgi:hypothetical protein